MLIELILLSVTLFLLYQIFLKREKGLPPGEYGLPLIGYIPKRSEPITSFMRKLQAKHGDLFMCKFGMRNVVFMTDFPTIKSAFNKQEFSGRPDFYTLRLFRKFQNKGVVISEGDVWHTNRRFTLRVLRDLGLGKSSLSSIICHEVQLMIDQMMKNEGKSSKIELCLNVAIVNVIMEITAGKRYDINDPDSLRWMKIITDTFLHSNGPLEFFNFQPWLVYVIPDFVKKAYFGLGNMKELSDEFLSYLREIVREHEKTFDKENPRDFIDNYLIEHQEQKGKPGSIYVDDDYFDLVSIIADFYVAGSETTSSTIRWYCYYMAKYPEIQKKIQAEIDSVVPADRLPEYEDKEKLPYFEASVNDVQRMASLTPIGVPHRALEDTTLNGYKIPKGTIMIAGAEFCHKNPKYWKKPNELYPEHFLDENGKFSPAKEGYLPFVIGKRQCLGESLAKMKLILYLSAILQTFEILEPENEPISLKCDPTAHHTFSFPLSQNVILKKRIHI